jgi:hypothetical protein
MSLTCPSDLGRSITSDGPRISARTEQNKCCARRAIPLPTLPSGLMRWLASPVRLGTLDGAMRGRDASHEGRRRVRWPAFRPKPMTRRAACDPICCGVIGDQVLSGFPRAESMCEEPERWQLACGAAELYERYLVPAVTLPWALDLVDRVGVGPDARVLDLACGTGVVARTAASRVQGAGRVAALDLNPGMLTVARSLAPATGPSIEWYEGSALALPFDDGEFQVVLCQLGLQFFPDRRRALQEILRVLALGGRVGASVYSAMSASLRRTPFRTRWIGTSGQTRRGRREPSIRSQICRCCGRCSRTCFAEVRV